MKNGSDNFRNEHGFEFVTYIYGELDQAGRDAFESHLSVCDECAMELASYSDARLGVIEWRREDFDHLETPAIVVPWLSEKQVVAKAEPAGAFTRFVEALGAFPMFAKAGIGFSAAAFAIAIFYFGAFSPSSKPENVAVIKNDDIATPRIQTDSKNETPPQYVATNDRPITAKTKNTVDRSERTPRVAVIRASTQPTIRRNEVASTGTNKTNVTTAKKAPRLTTVEDEDDKSLRLADLFAEIGSSEEA